MDRKKLHKDNTGMTLLEVIVAVSIFSITAIVLLQSFVTSSRINKKSNTYLEATSTAQNVMEEIKAKRFKEIALAFNYPVDRTTGKSRFSFLESQTSEIGNSLLIKEVTQQNDGSYTDVRKYNEADGDDDSKVTASVISHNGGVSYKLNPNKTGKYYYTMSDVKTLNNSFDVLVEFDSGKDSGYKKEKTSDTDEKNDYLSPNISKLDSKKNALLILPKDQYKNEIEVKLKMQLLQAEKKWNDDKEAWIRKNTTTDKDGTQHPTAAEITEYEANNPKPQMLDYNDVYKSMKTTLIVTLEKSGGSIVAKARYILSMHDYTNTKSGVSKYETMSFCPCHGASANIIDDKTTINSECFCTVDTSHTFYSSENEDDLQGVYIFYYPNYNSQDSKNPLDRIYFYNEVAVENGNKKTNYPVNLYVTKQRDEDAKEPTSAQEVKYRMSLTVTETPISTWYTSTGLFKASTRLRTNLDYDISNKDITKRTPVKQMSLLYQDANDSLNRKVKDYVAKNILSCNGLDDRKAQDRIYDVVVKVYKHGAAEGNFAGDPIVTLDGAKDN